MRQVGFALIHSIALFSIFLCEKGLSESPLEEDLVADSDLFLLSRAESVPADNLEEVSDYYLEGYIQALVDMHYYEHGVLVTVKDHKVYLANLPKNDLIANSILSFVQDMPGVRCVEVVPATQEEEKSKCAPKPHVHGIWFPQSTVLFPPLVADPRQPMYSAAYRFGDRVVGREAVSVALGDDFPLFRWRDVWRWHGDLQIGIEAGVWAVFNFDNVPHKNGEYCELVNTDYYVGFPLTYAFDRWAFRLRGYHISSHLGDEFLVNHPRYICERKNPSFEAIDFFTSYQFSKNLRGYFGPGFIIHSDKSFKMDTYYVQYGAELRILGSRLDYHRLYGTPFFAVHLENWQVRNWDLDMTFKFGYEISKLEGVGRKMRLFITYHHGFSYEGQFFLERTQYGEVGFSWGF